MRTFASFDGTSLAYRAWLPSGRLNRAILLFHRGHEHGGRLTRVVEQMRALQPEGTAFFAWDGRGHGLSAGPRGHARDFSDLVRDVAAFVAFLQAEHGLLQEDMAVIAHSIAAVVVGQWALDYAPRLRALVLVTPALEVKLYVPFARPALHLLKKREISSYVTGRWLTRDPQEAQAYDNDPLISKRIACNVLLGLHEAGKRLGRRGGDLALPTLLLCARSDWVVKNLPIRRLYRKLPHPLKSLRVYRDGHHSLFHDTISTQVISDVSAFVDACFAHPVDRDHRCGASFERYEWLKAGLPRLSPRRWALQGLKLAMRSAGRLSQGIRLGLHSGFSSGATLAYVYANEAQGCTALGRLIDRLYLNAPGWSLVRVRKAHLEQLVVEALQRLGSPEPLRLFDLAGGPGHYWLPLAQAFPHLQIRVRDVDIAALEEGRRRAAELGLTSLEFERGDAFDTASLDTLGGGWHVGVISGLLELFSDNHAIEVALAGAARAIAMGGYLIYTNQPWHPQLELIAELLTHANGQPWIMRCRSQAEMDDLVSRAGFDKVAMYHDDTAVFTVSLARRR